MKMRPAMKFLLPVILALAVAFLAGCTTTPPVDWNTRIGNYTYAQAVTELGPPARQARLNNDFGADQTIGSSYNNQMLQLTFDTDSTLAAWSKNY